MAQAAEEFKAFYLFQKSDVTVVIGHSQDKNLRAKPMHAHEVDMNGGFGKFARWTTKLRTAADGYTEVQFQNEHSKDYLRIHNSKVDVAGKGGPFCWFRVHYQNNDCVKLESIKTEGEYIAVDSNGVRVGSGGPWCRLYVRREGAAPAFSKPYFFKTKKEVIIEHRDRAFVRVMDNGSVNTQGGRGELARFEAEPMDGGKKVKLKNIKNGGYLRIHGGKVDCGGKGGPWTVFVVHPVDVPYQVRLESDKCNGEFLALKAADNTLEVGAGKHKRCFFTFYRNE